MLEMVRFQLKFSIPKGQSSACETWVLGKLLIFVLAQDATYLSFSEGSAVCVRGATVFKSPW